MRYCIARNVGSGKHWQIPLKTTLVKKILANSNEKQRTLANSNEKQRTLAICITDVELPSILYA